MSSSILEQIRENLQDVETLEKTLARQLAYKSENPKESVLTDHKIKNLLETTQKKCADTLATLNDSDGSKKEELAIIAGQKSVNPQKAPDVWLNFYDRLKDIKDYHKKYIPAGTPYQARSDDYFVDSVFEPPFEKPKFTGEEANGKFVDLHHLYLEFTNLKKIKEHQEYKVGDYLWYLQHFDQFHEIPTSFKENDFSKYKRYLQNMAEYLKDFFHRVQPLTDFTVIDAQHKEDFEYRWKEGTIRGWEKRDIKDIKNNPLYCQACRKLFTNEHTFVNHFNGKKHKKNAKDMEQNLSKPTNELEDKEDGDQVADVAEIKNKELAELEVFIIQLKELLGDVVHDTLNQIRKKQTRTWDELQAESYDFKDANEGEEDEDDEPVYNPKNLPLGWDGKPIPYWLYKLHGLGIEYKCEICGNYSYWGRRAFERHFQEWRHAYGMKCLRIPNTVHFKEITSINDALTLHRKLMYEAEVSRWKPDMEEEFEDSEGNVLNKKRYLDLERQGLL
jgi:splicing factor 3A subunit 3